MAFVMLVRLVVVYASGVVLGGVVLFGFACVAFGWWSLLR